MRSTWLALGLWFVASMAQAQVEQGDFKLSIDTDVFNHSSLLAENDGIEASATTRNTSFGPGGSALATGLPGYVGFGFGYVIHPRLVPQLHFAFAFLSGETEFEGEGESESFEEPTETSLMLRPELEIVFNPDGGAVGYGLVGFDYRRLSQEEDGQDGEPDSSDSLNAYGPTLGLGVHIFAGRASVDLAAHYSYLIVKVASEYDGESEDNDNDLSAHVFSLTAGLSLWP